MNTSLHHLLYVYKLSEWWASLVMIYRIVSSNQQIVASLAETPSQWYHWYIYFLYAPIFLHNKLMLTTWQFIFLENNMFNNIPYKQVWLQRKNSVFCSFVYFIKLCIWLYTYLIKCIVFLHTLVQSITFVNWFLWYYQCLHTHLTLTLYTLQSPLAFIFP